MHCRMSLLPDCTDAAPDRPFRCRTARLSLNLNSLMPLQDITLNIREGRIPADVQDFIDQAADSIEQFIANRSVRISGFVPSDFDRVYPALEAVAEQELAAGDVFCEWGSGFGVVTMLAAMLEFQAYGIEIERSLVEEARVLAEDFDLPVEFVAGSFVPAGGETLVEEAFNSDIAWLTSHADDAYPQLGLSLNDFDVIYAFPWPGEEEAVSALFDEFASVGALLLTFGQMDGVHARRKVIRK